LHKVIVHTDADSGSGGELNLDARVRTNAQACADLYSKDGDSCGQVLVKIDLPEIHAKTGDVVEIERTIPLAVDSITDDQTSPDEGIPINLGAWYALSFKGTENDVFMDDELGQVHMPLLDEAGKIRYGVHTDRSSRTCLHYPHLGFCGPDGPSHDGAYSIEWELRAAMLADLRPVDIKILNVPGSTRKLVCGAIQNAGPRNADRFDVAFQIDGTTPPNGKASAAGLPMGEAGELCAELTLTPGQHRLAVIVDEAGSVEEADRTNNRYEEPYTMARTETDGSPATVPGAGTKDEPDADEPPVFTPRTTPTPVPSGDRADLTIGTIRLNGRPSDDQDACKEGKNDLVVSVKNVGAAEARTFVVRLAVDGEQVAERSVAGLDAGQAREIRFGDVRLKRGARSVEATADAKGAVAESDEGNNGQTITVRCGDHD
jgi:hypothetical protein